MMAFAYYFVISQAGKWKEKRELRKEYFLSTSRVATRVLNCASVLVWSGYECE